MADQWAGRGNSIDSPADNAEAVTPSDSVDIATTSRALFIGGGGDVSIDTVGGQESVVFAGLAGGSILPVRAKRVNATGTTATGIVALW